MSWICGRWTWRSSHGSSGIFIWIFWNVYDCVTDRDKSVLRTTCSFPFPFPKFPVEKWEEPRSLWRAVSAKRKHRLWDTHSPVPTPPSGMPTPASIPNQSRTSSWKGDYRRPGLSLLEPGTCLPHLEWSQLGGSREGTPCLWFDWRWMWLGDANRGTSHFKELKTFFLNLGLGEKCQDTNRLQPTGASVRGDSQRCPSRQRRVGPRQPAWSSSGRKAGRSHQLSPKTPNALRSGKRENEVLVTLVDKDA